MPSARDQGSASGALAAAALTIPPMRSAMMRLTLSRIWQAASGSFVVSSSRNFWRSTSSLQSLSARTVEGRPLARSEVLLDQGRNDRARALQVRVVGEHDHEGDSGAVPEVDEASAVRPRPELAVVADDARHAVEEGEVRALLADQELVSSGQERRQDELAAQAAANHHAADVRDAEPLDAGEALHRGQREDGGRHLARLPGLDAHGRGDVVRGARVEQGGPRLLVLGLLEPLALVVGLVVVLQLLGVDLVPEAIDRLALGGGFRLCA